MSDEQSMESKQTFVPPDDRPEVKLTPGAPLSELRVRDLEVILGKQIVRRQGSREAADRLKHYPVIYRHIAKTSHELTGCEVPDLTDAPGLQRVIEPLLGSEQPVNALTPPAPSAVESENWSGARLMKKGGDPGDPENPKGAAFRSVWATWTLPQVKPPGMAGGAGHWYSSSWVGIGGGGAWRETTGAATPEKRWSRDVLQAGFAHDVSADGKGVLLYNYQAWYAWDPGLYPDDPDYPTYFQKASIAVAPGDVVSVKVEYKKDDQAGLIEFSNLTQNIRLPVSVVIPTGSGASVDRFRGDTIEWVVERPYNGSGYYPLANYTAIDFTSAGGETYGGSTVIPEQGNLINMQKNSVASFVLPHTLHIDYLP